MEKNMTPLQSLREKMIVAMTGQVLEQLVKTDHKNTYLSDQISLFVDTFISRHEHNALIPVHVPHPLTENVLRKIARDGIVNRTVPVEVEDFYPFDDEGREACINEALIKEGNGKLTDIKYRVVGFKDDGTVHFIEVTGNYTPPTESKPRGRSQREAVTAKS